MVCNQCGADTKAEDCVADAKTLEVMDLYKSCTEDRKMSAGKLKMHLPSRLLGSKKDKKPGQEVR